VKSYIYTIEDTFMGIELTIEGELVDWGDNSPPEIVINDISYGDKPLSLWCLSDRFIKHCQDRIFQTWCFEPTKKEQA
jgi:hypothetical protein